MGEPHPRGGSAAGRLGRRLLLSVGCVLGVGCALDTFGFAEGQSNLETEPVDTQEITAPGPTSSGGGSSDRSSTGSTVCGNGEVEPGEDCDDTNAISDDGCQVGCVETKAVTIAAGGGHTCVLLVDGGVLCWGAGGDGRLGIGSTNTIGDDEPIQSVPRVDLGGAASVLTLGGSHSCALMGSDVRCWGDAGTLGTGIDMDIGDNESPAEGGTAMVGGPVRQVDAGAAFTCAVLTNGGVWCWGSCLDGECGFGTTGEFDIGAEGEGASGASASASGLASAAGTSRTAIATR